MKRERAFCQRGAAAVEMALTLPIFLSLVLGGIDYGYFFFVDQIVTNAAREGARVGTLHKDDGEAFSDSTDTATQYLQGAGLDLSRATIVATVLADSVVMEIDYATGSVTGFAAYLVPDSATARAEMRR